MHQNASNKRVAQVLQQVILGVESGLSVVDAFDACGDTFPSLFLAVLRIGLERGEMGETLETLSKFYHEQNELKGKISSALIYPKILMVIFLVAFIVVCKFIVPSFYSMFQESNVTLNGLTNGVMKGLIYIGEHLLLFGGFFLGLILLFQLLKRSEVVHQKMDYLKLKFFKRYHQIYYAYLFSETLNLLWYCGYAKNESISLCGQVIPNFYIKRELEVVKRQMEQGMYLGAALEEVQIFDPTLCKMLLIGEQGDFLSTNVLNASRYYHLQYKMMLDRLVKMIEPSIILLMAILIGFIILVIFIPMLNAFRLVM